MTVLVAVLIGLLFAAGTWLLLSRQLVREVAGLILISHGANLLLLLSGGVRRGGPPILGSAEPLANPLPQALILTAIVIGFGMMGFLLALGYRMHAFEEGDDDEEEVA
ncbi:MAG: NADH-quinone oxidoreductase subunit K [Armatimonadota bacterium]|nr:NADH-quinone oxidoreductase subunit K [Armatimonadota bacterium]MDR7487955.1 NADH-quinone oxidoreductase subunit K [Armatimonadota bacterium]MDR7491874.1 NADH-quinone oxidoreductase subunit K [Armatimonadota bacterium]MDR7528387.1 NADH-quinone oxidoreductase subunit K [Armatimonadota bacterium]MDR7574123.1 NADH-quinone oxidoreductase subunit K [Armatimonadota bacterium]